MLKLSWTHQTPREIPSSDVKYMLMVWLRETSAGRLRSTKNGTPTTNQKTWEVGWPTAGFTELPRGREEIYLRLWVKTRCWIKSESVPSKKGAKTTIRQRPKPAFSHHRDLRTYRDKTYVTNTSDPTIITGLVSEKVKMILFLALKVIFGLSNCQSVIKEGSLVNVIS